MTRDQKIKSKAPNARSKQRAQHAIVTRVQAAADTGSSVPDETEVATNITARDTTNATVDSQHEQTSVQQSATSSQEVVWIGVQPNWPSWPSSKPGPRSTPPPAGMRPINALRPEQLEEVGYNQQTGEPATHRQVSLDQPTAQTALGKYKQRL